MSKEIPAYPLAWPAGWKRTPAAERDSGQFKGTPDATRREMLDEVDRIALGRQAATHTIKGNVVVSTNVKLRKDGAPWSGLPEPEDTGVAVYFERNGKPMCFACDKFDRVWKNMRAIQRTIEALRGIERWGSSQMMERAFTGFLALAERTEDSCWTVLGIPFGSSVQQINDRFRLLSQGHHPDKGGTHEGQAKLSQARQEALAVTKES